MFLRIYPFNLYIHIPLTATSMALSNRSLAGPGYVILNVLRVMNIIGFLAVIAASVVMLVKTNTSTSRFFFFDAFSHVITATASTFLVISELCLFPAYFARNWPLLSPEHGFVLLSVIMITLGLDTLGNLNKDSDTQKALGMGMWRIVIGSGILVFILGFLNLIANFVFRDSRQGITARMVRSHGAVAIHESPKFRELHASPSMRLKTPTTNVTASPSTPTKSPSAATIRNPLKLVTTKLNTQNRNSILPSYHASPTSTVDSPTKDTPYPATPGSRYSRATACTKKKIFTAFGPRSKRESLPPPLPLNISAPLNTNPQFAHLVQRPDSALHPSRSYGRGGEDERRGSRAIHFQV